MQLGRFRDYRVGEIPDQYDLEYAYCGQFPSICHIPQSETDITFCCV